MKVNDMPRFPIAQSFALVAALAMPAYGQIAAPAQPTSVKAPTGDDAIRAAAEPFEKLAETSFSATPASIDSTIGEIEVAATGLKGSLAPDVRDRLSAKLADISSARKADNRAEMALAATEGYRVLVSAVSADAKTPTAVNLLDYVGFRYVANLKAKPSRWDDMTVAVTFGRGQWASIASQVKDTTLRAKVAKVLAGMGKAASGRDTATAVVIAQRELALVDDLETYFSKR